MQNEETLAERREYWSKKDGFWPNGKKLKLLVVKPNDGGCAFYRAINPLQKLQELYPNVVDIKIEQNPLNMEITANEDGKQVGKFNGPPELIDWADVVFVSNINNFGGPYTLRVIGTAKEKGKFVHFDTDDLLTNLYDEHMLKDVYEGKKLSEMTKHKYSNADLVTVTEEKFLNRVKEFIGQGNLLTYIPNMIDYTLPCWRMPKKPMKGPIRIGWAGGIHHIPDVEVFSKVPFFVNQKVGAEKVHWDFYGYPPPPDPKVNPDYNPKEDWQVKAWDNYRNKFIGSSKVRNYTIHKALPPDLYGSMYANMDIAIAPLAWNEFNDSKSRIKVAEVAAYGVPLIASDVGSYNLNIRDGETGFIIPVKSGKKAWIKALSDLIKNPKKIAEMGARLKREHKKEFDLCANVHQRLDIYEEAFKFKNYERR